MRFPHAASRALPRDFVDEWAQQPWDKAKEWVAPEALADAEAIHKWIGEPDYLITTDFLQSCPIPDHWQIGLTVEAADETHPPMPHVFVDVSKDGDTFRLDRIANDRAPGCPGTEILPSVHTRCNNVFCETESRPFRSGSFQLRIAILFGRALVFQYRSAK